VEAEQSVTLNVEQLTAVGVWQLHWWLGQVAGSIQTQQVVQPLLNRVTRGIPERARIQKTEVCAIL
jgi:hypothetical protein